MDEVFETQQQEPQAPQPEEQAAPAVGAAEEAAAPEAPQEGPQAEAQEEDRAETQEEVQAEAQAELDQPAPQDDPMARVAEYVDTAFQPVEVVDVQFRTGAKVYFFAPGDLTLKAGDHVIIETARGPEYGTCTAGNHTVPKKDIVPPLRSVLRQATAQDERQAAANREKEKRAHQICLQKIQEHGLDMQLVSAEYAFDGSKIIFFFTADDRVDFRELVKNLASIFHTRIELRQIGVRDKAKMVGGLGICGRPFCCSQFLDDFQPVSIKMAKTQSLSLNPTKISGTCGRLMCCLKYEQEAYEDLLRTSPKPESFVDTPGGRGTVVDVNLLRQSVKVRMEDEPDTVETYKNCDICVLRNGKAKKNDPPIPADQAPISGGGKRKKPAEVEEEAPMHLDPIRFRYRPDDIVAEEPEQETEEFEQAAQRQSRRKKRPQAERPAQEPREAKDGPQAPDAPKREGQRRRNRGRKPRPEGEAPQGKPEGQPKPPRKPRPEGQRPQQPKAGQKPGPRPEGQGQEAPAKPRNSRRRRRPGGGGGNGGNPPAPAGNQE